jgi:hypothetical protein
MFETVALRLVRNAKSQSAGQLLTTLGQRRSRAKQQSIEMRRPGLLRRGMRLARGLVGGEESRLKPQHLDRALGRGVLAGVLILPVDLEDLAASRSPRGESSTHSPPSSSRRAAPNATGGSCHVKLVAHCSRLAGDVPSASALSRCSAAAPVTSSALQVLPDPEKMPARSRRSGCRPGESLKFEGGSRLRHGALG